MVAQGPIAEKPLGLRILLVEDNFLVANSIKRMLTEWGCEVVGPAPSVAEALRLAEGATLHGGILDINIQGGSSAPIAAGLEERSCPYFFITGYASPHLLPAGLLTRRRLNKPFSREALWSAIQKEFLTS